MAKDRKLTMERADPPPGRARVRGGQYHDHLAKLRKEGVEHEWYIIAHYSGKSSAASTAKRLTRTQKTAGPLVYGTWFEFRSRSNAEGSVLYARWTDTRGT